MYPIASNLPRNGMRLSDFETNVKSIIRSKRAIAFINHDNGLCRLEDVVDDPAPVG
jgi:hypothetical protein